MYNFSLKTTDHQKDILLSISGDQGDQWNLRNVTVPLPTVLSGFTIVFEGITGNGFQGDIAIDDISLEPGNCDSLASVFSCDFEDNATLCGFTQDTKDDFDWTRQYGQTPSQSTGPLTDHTFNNQYNSHGHYMYTEASSPQKKDDKALLMSPFFTESSPLCLMFYYNMHGNHIGSLHVFIQTRDGHRPTSFSIWGYSGTEWHLAQVNISQSTAKIGFQVVFEGIIGDGFLGDIAIDDVSVLRGQCSSANNHKSALASFGFDTTNLDLDLPYLYCIPKMHKNPYKQRFIAGSSKCSTKSVSILLTKVLSEIKSGLQKYCSTVYSRSGINQMWILKNSKELLEHLKSTHFSRVHSIKAFDFSTLYTTIPHSKLKERLAKIISNAFTSKNGNRKYKFIVVNYDKTYFVKEKSDSENKYTETDIIQMLNFLIDNIFVVFGGKVFQQIVGIPMGTNCAPLLADIFLYSYEAEFIQSLVSEGKRYLASDFNFTYRYIDDVLSINNPKFADYLSSIYPSELEVKETTETNNSASYLDIMLSYDTDGHMNTSLYDKRDDFNFSITNFPFLSSNIPSSPAYGVFISQLIRYARASTKYTDFVLRARRLSDKLLSQGYVCDRLTSSLRKFYGRYGELVIHYDVPLSRMVDDILS
ncbi:hypothetical protein FSP39_002807 [Pinctada imbricata]|uniref:Uncharacterized protein n=1 Tax=Pinctada imbricata TaxID=66713 RepID=A0AA89BLF2_PINIB|nr:hypothetical protein FSP39_002807 [Pinctada imbricata]